MAKKSIRSVDVAGKRVLMRVDFNVPLDDQCRITDDRRIQAALPSIRSVIGRGGRLILMSHLGRPKGEPDPKVSLKPCAKRLGELLGKNVLMAESCVGPQVAQAVKALGDGDVCLLENLRFHKAETIKDKDAAKDPALRRQKDEFARQLAGLADVYVNDAFGTCHRDNASMLTVPQKMAGKPKVMGFLVEKELKYLMEALAKPARPFIAVLGGAKVSDKIGVIENLLERVDHVLVGGAMTHTFMAAQGLEVGRSLCERDKIDLARTLLKRAGDKLHLPIDCVVAPEMKAGAPDSVVTGAIPADRMGLDIGPRTLAAYRDKVLSAKTVVWNGPMGAFEYPPFDAGTVGLAKALAEATERGATTIVGGVDSASAMEAAGLADKVSHISTGGGASLELLEGKSFAAIEVLDEA